MPKSYRVAHIREQGQDLIIIPLSAQSVRGSSRLELTTERGRLQECSDSAGLRGIVCLVWQDAMGFSWAAPRAWHPFFRSIDMRFVRQNLNRVLICG